MTIAATLITMGGGWYVLNYRVDNVEAQQDAMAGQVKLDHEKLVIIQNDVEHLGEDFDEFKYEQREQRSLLEEIGREIRNSSVLFSRSREIRPVPTKTAAAAPQMLTPLKKACRE